LHWNSFVFRLSLILLGNFWIIIVLLEATSHQERRLFSVFLQLSRNIPNLDIYPLTLFVSNTFCWAITLYFNGQRLHKSRLKRADDWQVSVKKIDYLTRDFHVKFHARNPYRTNREVKPESIHWYSTTLSKRAVLSKNYFYTQIKISIPAKFSMFKFFEITSSQE